MGKERTERKALRKSPVKSIQVDRPARLTRAGGNTPQPPAQTVPVQNTPTNPLRVGSSPAAGSSVELDGLKAELQELRRKHDLERQRRIKAERELREWKEMNGLLVQMQGVLEHLQGLLQMGPADQVEPVGGSQGGGRLMNTIKREATADEPPTEAPHWPIETVSMVTLSGGLEVEKSGYSKMMGLTDYRKYTSELLTMVFGREMLATHSLNGRRAMNAKQDLVKKALPSESVRQLIDHVQEKFNIDSGSVRSVIRTKLNNEDKLWKKKNFMN